MLGKTNIEEVLRRQKIKKPSSQKIIEQVQAVLEKNQLEREAIAEKLKTGRSSKENHFDFALLESDKIYHIEHIKAICIDYRLRFLDSRFFKGEIPEEAISKIRQLETQHNTNIKGLKILAPSKLFKLEDKDDPLLFAPIGNDYFYLIHKWGNDLHPFRKIMMWPFKNIGNLTLLVVIASYLVTLLVPEGLFSKKNSEF